MFTGREHFGTLMKWLLGNLHQRKLVRKYEEYLSKNFFNGDEITLIPRTHDQTVHIKIGIEKEQPIHNLGDGLQQILILTLPIFLHKDKNLLLFIEEPELYLHPGFQRLLIDTFLKDDGNVRQVFVATHSHQFLDITIDENQCSVYKFQKELQKTKEHSGDEVEANFTIKNTSNSDFSLLADLGVRNSSVLLSNCTIWVEGITDRLYLRKYLELYHTTLEDNEIEFFEDIHFSFVEYGGNNITHWSFLDQKEGMDVTHICGNLFLISDSDTEKKQKRQKELEEALYKRYYCLECREIENMLTPEVIKKVVKDYEGDNDIALRNFRQTTYQKQPLGKFIENSVLPKDYTSNRWVKDKEKSKPYSAASGTIKDKLPFCYKALDSIDKLSSEGIDHVLSPEAKTLCEKIYEFIKTNNQ